MQARQLHCIFTPYRYHKQTLCLHINQLGQHAKHDVLVCFATKLYIVDTIKKWPVQALAWNTLATCGNSLMQSPEGTVCQSDHSLQVAGLSGHITSYAIGIRLIGRPSVAWAQGQQWVESGWWTVVNQWMHPRWMGIPCPCKHHVRSGTGQYRSWPRGHYKYFNSTQDIATQNGSLFCQYVMPYIGGYFKKAWPDTTVNASLNTW